MHPQLTMIMVNSRIDELQAGLEHGRTRRSRRLRALTVHRLLARGAQT